MSRGVRTPSWADTAAGHGQGGRVAARGGAYRSGGCASGNIPISSRRPAPAVMIAMALMFDPELLIADEPTRLSM